MEQAVRKQVYSTENLCHGKYHGQDIGDAKRSSHYKQTGGNTVREKGVGKLYPRQDGIVGRKALLRREACDEAKMHVHIAVGTLPGRNSPIFVRKDGVAVEQKTPEYHKQGEDDKEGNMPF